MTPPRAPLLPALVLGLLVVAPLARGDEPAQDAFDPTDLVQLEALARQVERDGLRSLALASVVPALPEPLAFAVEKNTVENERAFRRKWFAAYLAQCEDAIARVTEVARPELKEKELELPPAKRVAVLRKKLAKLAKKQPAAAEAAALLEALLPRYDELLKLQKAGVERDEAVFAEREAETKGFLKRYDFGPKVASARAQGNAVIEVDLTETTWGFVQKEFASWKFPPLLDAAGQQVKLGDVKVEFAPMLTQGMVREALQKLTRREYFTVRYAKVEEIVESAPEVDEMIHIKCAKLLFGTYYFLQQGERLVVIREPEPAR